MNIDTIKNRIANFIQELQIEEYGECKEDLDTLFDQYVDVFASPYGEDYISIEADVLIKHGAVCANILMALSYCSIAPDQDKEYSAVKVSTVKDIFNLSEQEIHDAVKKLQSIYREDHVFLQIVDGIIYFFHDLSILS